MLQRTVIERHVVDEAEAIVTATLVNQANNSCMRRGGFTPVQWVLGKDVRVPDSLLDDAEIGSLEVH